MPNKPFDFYEFARFIKENCEKNGIEVDGKWHRIEGDKGHPNIRNTETAYLAIHPEHAEALKAHRQAYRKMYTDLAEEIQAPGRPAREAEAAQRAKEFEKKSAAREVDGHVVPLDKDPVVVGEGPAKLRRFADDFKTAGRGTLKAIPAVSAIADMVGYTANQKEAEAKLTKLMVGKEIPKLSAEAVAEYGHIVAGLKVEKGLTFDMHEAIGFSKFLDWAKKNNLPEEAVVKVNPTSKSREQIEEALATRGQRMSQAEGEVRLAQAPDVRKPEAQGQGVA